MKLFTFSINTIKCIILGLMILSFQGCDIDPGELNETNTILVYCDFTTSLNTESSKAIQEFGEWIINSAPRPSNIQFYEISRVAKAPFFREELPKMPIELDGFKAEMWKIDQDSAVSQHLRQFEASVNSLRDRYESDPNYRGANSCITNSMIQANKYLKSNVSQDQAGNNVFLIVISDMIEECENSVLGRVYMKTRNASQVKGRFEDLSKQIGEADSFETNFHQVRPMVLQITRQDQTNPISLYQTEFEELWHQIFVKMGFSESSLEKWHFLPQTPSDQIWTL